MFAQFNDEFERNEILISELVQLWNGDGVVEMEGFLLTATVTFTTERRVLSPVPT